jgi:radical SAM protein with 4Fe4S-binding SPASM domain
LHIVALNNACNQRCAYCAVGANGEVAGLPGDVSLLPRLAAFIVDSAARDFCVEFQGGEPLGAIKALKQLVELVQERAYHCGKTPHFRLVSNLTLLTDGTIEYLRRNRFDVCTTVDGPRELHDSQRVFGNGAGTYRRVIENVALLRTAGIQVGALTVVTAKSLRYASTIVEHHAEMGFARLVLNPVLRLGNAATRWSTLAITPAQYAVFWREVSTWRLQSRRNGFFVPSERMMDLLIAKVLLGHDPQFVDFSSPCGCVTGQIAYDMKGHVYPCDEARFGQRVIVGNYLSESYGKIRESSLVGALRSASVTDRGACGACPYTQWCGRCPIKTYHEYGSFERIGRTNVFCQFYRLIFDAFFGLLRRNWDDVVAMAFRRDFVV